MNDTDIRDHQTAAYVSIIREVRFLSPEVALLRAVAGMTSPGKREINPAVNVETYQALALADNTLDLVSSYDFVIDGTDNFPAKFLINDACVLAKEAFSHGGILRFDGQTMTYVPGSACYRCVFLQPPPKNAVPTCSQAGVLGAVAGMLGTIQAAEALKYLIGKGQLLTDRLLIFNAFAMEFRTARFKRNPACPICGTHPTITELRDYEQGVCDLRKPR